jgi:hypothetical protein
MHGNFIANCSKKTCNIALKAHFHSGNISRRKKVLQNVIGRHKFSVGKKFWSWKFSTFKNDTQFWNFSVRGNFSWVKMGLEMSDSLDRCVLTHYYISGINRTGTQLFNEPVYTPWLWYSCFRCLDYTGQDYPRSWQICLAADTIWRDNSYHLQLPGQGKSRAKSKEFAGLQ